MNEQTLRGGIVERVGFSALLGFVFGFAVIHPVSMVIFRWFDPCFANGMPDVMRDDLLGTALYAFDRSMLPMGGVYGLLCAAIAVVGSHQHFTIRRQRDVLAEQNERLIRLEESNRRSTQFMVHDLKTPLGCILGFSTMLLNQRNYISAEDTILALQRIARQARKMTDEIGDHLDFARMQEGERWQREEISVADLLREVAADVSLPESEKRIRIAKNDTHGLCVWGDRRLLRRVLVNLAANALKHNSADTHIVLDFKIREQTQEVLFSCADTGGGIPSEVLPSVFRVFRTNGDNGSTGLGLAFCQAVVEAHGGRIWYRSEKGNGSTFLFTIPLKEEVQNDDAVTFSQASASG